MRPREETMGVMDVANRRNVLISGTAMAASAIGASAPIQMAEAQQPGQKPGMSFGQAIDALKNGRRVARAGWNGVNMYIYLLAVAGYEPCICIHTAQGKEQPGWLASQPDILSTDWETLG
jgi:hypothetical protein